MRLTVEWRLSKVDGPPPKWVGAIQPIKGLNRAQVEEGGIHPFNPELGHISSL